MSLLAQFMKIFNFQFIEWNAVEVQRYARVIVKTRRVRRIATSVVVLPDGSVLLRTRARASSELVDKTACYTCFFAARMCIAHSTLFLIIAQVVS